MFQGNVLRIINVSVLWLDQNSKIKINQIALLINHTTTWSIRLHLEQSINLTIWLHLDQSDCTWLHLDLSDCTLINQTAPWSIHQSDCSLINQIRLHLDQFDQSDCTFAMPDKSSCILIHRYNYNTEQDWKLLTCTNIWPCYLHLLGGKFFDGCYRW